MARKNKQIGSSIWRWVSFILFALVLALLAVSIFKRQSPVRTLKMLGSDKDPQDSIANLSKKQLIELLAAKNNEIKDLQSTIESLEIGNNFQKGRITTTSDALNMRNSPSLGKNIVMKIPNGSIVDILFYDSDIISLDGQSGQWCKIKYAGTEGWVWGNYLTELE